MPFRGPRRYRRRLCPSRCNISDCSIPHSRDFSLQMAVFSWVFVSLSARGTRPLLVHVGFKNKKQTKKSRSAPCSSPPKVLPCGAGAVPGDWQSTNRRRGRKRSSREVREPGGASKRGPGAARGAELLN